MKSIRRFVSGAELSEILSGTPGDPDLIGELSSLYEQLDVTDTPLDPWERLGD